jgi:hypothetical protein
MKDLHEDISLIACRQIEAGIVAPLLEAMVRKYGRTGVYDVLTGVVEDLGIRSGREAAQRFGGNSLSHLEKGIDRWSQNGALQLKYLEKSNQHLFFDVHRCRYAEMYMSLGLSELGSILSCGRDFAFARGFNPYLRLERTQTIMSGHDHCDFRFFLTDHSS